MFLASIQYPQTRSGINLSPFKIRNPLSSSSCCEEFCNVDCDASDYPCFKEYVPRPQASRHRIPDGHLYQSPCGVFLGTPGKLSVRPALCPCIPWASDKAVSCSVVSNAHPQAMSLYVPPVHQCVVGHDGCATVDTRRSRNVNCNGSKSELAKVLCCPRWPEVPVRNTCLVRRLFPSP